MSTPVAHTMAGFAFYLATKRTEEPVFLSKRLTWFFFISILPDFDFIPVIFLGFDRANNVHHVYSHTIGFVLLVSICLGCLWWVINKNPLPKSIGIVFLLLSFHLLIDYLTSDSRPPIGAMLFWPLSDTYYNSPISVFNGVSKKNLASVLSWYNVSSMIRDGVVLLIPISVIAFKRNLIPHFFKR